VLVILSVTLCLCALGAYGTAKVTRKVLERFGLDLMTVLLWLGLAEYPTETRVSTEHERLRRQRDRSPGRRRRSPHYAFSRPRVGRRRPARPSSPA